MKILEKYLPYFLILPSLLFFLALIVYPTIFSIYISFFQWDLGRKEYPFIGLMNYIKIFNDSFLFKSFINTIYFIIPAIVLQFLIGLGLALLLNRELKGKRIITLILTMPMVLTPAATSFMWKLIYHPTIGIFNYFLSFIGVPPRQWIFSPSEVILSLIIIDTWQWSPFIMLSLLAGLNSLPRDFFEAASIDGASPLRTLRYITLPLLKPIIITVLFFRSIDLFKTFDIIFLLTGGGPGWSSTTINIYVFLQAFTYLHLGYSSVLAIIVTFILLLIFRTFYKRWGRV